MSTPEFSRIIRMDGVGDGTVQTIAADAQECAALARRFNLVAITSLSAVLRVRPEAAGCVVTGRVEGSAVAACAVSAEDVVQEITEEVAVTYAADVAAVPTEEEIELGDVDLDRLPLESGRIDLGELAAMTFALALDPYPKADGARLDEARKFLLSEEEAAANEEAEKRANSPFSGLKS